MLQNDVYSYDYRIVGRDVSDNKEIVVNQKRKIS